jgi:replication initiation protein RepC
MAGLQRTSIGRKMRRLVGMTVRMAVQTAHAPARLLGLSAARVKMLNRVLFEAGIFVIRDNEQGKRYGRRGPDGRIIEAYGFDLTPLAPALRRIRFAAEAKAERERKKALRKRATIARPPSGRGGSTPFKNP